jgi:hypothetical protein
VVFLLYMNFLFILSYFIMDYNSIIFKKFQFDYRIFFSTKISYFESKLEFNYIFFKGLIKRQRIRVQNIDNMVDVCKFICKVYFYSAGHVGLMKIT